MASGCKLMPIEPNEYSELPLETALNLRQGGLYELVVTEPEDNKDEIKYAWYVNGEEVFEPTKSLLLNTSDKKGKLSVNCKGSINDSLIINEEINIYIYNKCIILKADDLVFDPKNVVSDKWHRFFNYIRNQNIKASVGLIGFSIEQGNKKYFNYIRNLHNSGRFEIWNHGYTHELNVLSQDSSYYYSEFKNRTEEEQYLNLTKTQSLVKDSVGIVLTTFGAPGNAIDDNTTKALERIGELKIWFYGLPSTSKYLFKRKYEIEYPTFYADYSKFMANYKDDQNLDVLQIHPNHWGNFEFNEFHKIITELKKDGVVFVNPSEYLGMTEYNNVNQRNSRIRISILTGKPTK